MFIPKSTEADETGETPLMTAIGMGKYGLVEELLNIEDVKKSSIQLMTSLTIVNAKNKQGMTALHLLYTSQPPATLFKVFI